MNKKQIIAIVLTIIVAVVLAVVIFSCSSDEKSESSTKGQATGQTTVATEDSNNETTEELPAGIDVDIFDDDPAEEAEGESNKNGLNKGEKTTGISSEGSINSESNNKGNEIVTIPSDSKNEEEVTTKKPSDSKTEENTTKPSNGTDSDNAGNNKKMTYEEYHAMTAKKQKAYMNTFKNIDDFFDWYNQAKADYEEQNPDIEIENGSVNLDDLIKK